MSILSALDFELRPCTFLTVPSQWLTRALLQGPAASWKCKISLRATLTLELLIELTKTFSVLLCSGRFFLLNPSRLPLSFHRPALQILRILFASSTLDLLQTLSPTNFIDQSSCWHLLSKEPINTVVILHAGHNIHFPNEKKKSWSPCHVSIGYVNMFFCDMPVKSLADIAIVIFFFSNWEVLYISWVRVIFAI